MVLWCWGVWYLPSTIHHPPSTIHHPPSTISLFHSPDQNHHSTSAYSSCTYQRLAGWLGEYTCFVCVMVMEFFSSFFSTHIKSHNSHPPSLFVYSYICFTFPYIG